MESRSSRSGSIPRFWKTVKADRALQRNQFLSNERAIVKITYQEKLKRLVGLLGEVLRSRSRRLTIEEIERLVAFAEELEDSGAEFSSQLFQACSEYIGSEIHAVDELVCKELKGKQALSDFNFNELSGHQKIATLTSVMIVAGLLRRQDSRQLKEIIRDAVGDSDG